MSGRAGQQSNKIKVLFVAANPADSRLMLDEEIRAITEKIRATEHRDLLELISIWAVRPDDLLQSLNSYKPQIVHFSAHGSKTGEIILLDNYRAPKAVSAQAIKALFTILRDNVRVVVLNACYSQPQARAITEVIDCAVGMNDAVTDEAAIIFAASFYRAIGFGRSIQEAFEQGKVALLLEGIPQENTPALLVRAGIDPSRITLVAPEERSDLREGENFLTRGKAALLRNDYAVAKSTIEKAIEIFNEDEFPEKAAKANFLLALIQLSGKRPFAQTRPVMNAVESHLRTSIDLDGCYSYILTLAICKLDFARNGLPSLLPEAQGLIARAKQATQTPADVENLGLLSSCQPHLVHDFLNR